MFYDERIEKARGKISKTAILLSFFISLILGALHLANLLRNAPNTKYLWFTFPEFVIALSTLTVLTVGFIRFWAFGRDERTDAEQSAFYSKAAGLLVKINLAAFAFVIPIVSYIGKPSLFADGGCGGIFYVLFFIVGIYVVQSFRRNDVYFNYSIMEADSYYKGVFKNIGKLALYALALLGISEISFIGVVAIKSLDSARVLGIVFDILGYYVGAFIEVAVLYLLYSFLEKCSYNSESSISKSTVISLGIAIIIYTGYTFGMIFIDSLPISQASAMQIVSLLSSLEIYTKFALLIFLTYFGYEYQRRNKNTLLSAGCITVLIGQSLSVLLGQISSTVIFVLMPEITAQDGYIISRIISVVNVTIDDVARLSYAVGFILMLFALVNDGLIHRAHRFAILGFAAIFGTDLFLRTQTDVLSQNIYRASSQVVVLIYLFIVVALTAKSRRRKLD